MALVHYPVVDKNGAVISSAVTNLDLHDIARAAKTFGVYRFFVVTPLSDQFLLVDRIVSHWVTGYGARYNPKRRQALELIRTAASIDEAGQRIAEKEGCPPQRIATSAHHHDRCISYGRCRKIIDGKNPCLLLFGTAWGLDRAVMANSDHILQPVTGCGDWNHLSVRSAVSIILDRLISKRG